jgi:hypothetical protein
MECADDVLHFLGASIDRYDSGDFEPSVLGRKLGLRFSRLRGPADRREAAVTSNGNQVKVNRAVYADAFHRAAKFFQSLPFVEENPRPADAEQIGDLAVGIPRLLKRYGFRFTQHDFHPGNTMLYHPCADVNTRPG